ncbi:uncharacterized protein LOC123192752 [Mangifera indica]|uniref:uncharacterized protein LOC123192752 n=1 Tax=Mangifera indica TaxID=29780 RepID=UPI001CF974D7|nr:uncharacterized protein LOC123192752 [Mangifera indica]
MHLWEHGDIVIFHYRKIAKSQENRKIWRRGIEAIIVTPQSIQEAGKAIPTLVLMGFSFGIVDHSSNQLPLPPQTANTSNLNIQENVESAAGCSSSVADHSSNRLPLPPQIASNLNIQENVEFAAGCSSGTVNHEDYQFPLAPKTADTVNQNSIQANAQSSAGSSFGIVNHENYQLPLPTDSSNQSDIQANAESADLQQHLMQITEKAEFSSSYIFKSFTVSGDGMLQYDYEFENQTFPQVTTNDFFTNPATPNFLPSPTPGSLSELPDFMELSLEGNKKNLKRGKESLGELPANSLGEGYQDHMSFQQNPELQAQKEGSGRWSSGEKRR